MIQRYDFAPLDGITKVVFRQVYHRLFGGADRYFIPFFSPTDQHILTKRDQRELDPAANAGLPVVPQVMTRRAPDFLWAAEIVADMGYTEVNLNLGCPSGTVTAKGKGSGMLADPEGLDRFLEAVFARVEGRVSIKTRLGMESPEECPRLLEIVARYPISLLIIHPRVREDYYRRPVRLEAFAQALETYPGAVCYNGALVTAEGCARFQAQFPQVERVMLGQGLLANPALIRQAKGGEPPEREELRAFHEEMYRSYLAAFGSQKNTVYHMKELWSYLGRLFEGADKPLKQIRKASDSLSYERGVDAMFRLPLRSDALW